MATFGIIYATGSKMIRRIISNSSNFSVHVGPGESLLAVERAQCPSVFEAQDHVEAATGQTPLNLTCAVIDNSGNVVGLLKADPTIDRLHGSTLIAAPDEIELGCTYDAKTAAFTIPQKIIPASIDKETKQPIAEQIVDAKTVSSVDVAAAISAAQANVSVDAGPVVEPSIKPPAI